LEARLKREKEAAEKLRQSRLDQEKKVLLIKQQKQKEALEQKHKAELIEIERKAKA